MAKIFYNTGICTKWPHDFSAPASHKLPVNSVTVNGVTVNGVTVKEPGHQHAPLCLLTLVDFPKEKRENTGGTKVAGTKVVATVAGWFLKEVHTQALPLGARKVTVS